MKVLHIIPQMHIGGAQRMVLNLCREQADTDEVFLCTLFDQGKDVILLTHLPDSVRYFRLGKHSGFDWRMFWRLFRLIKKINPDVVHTHQRALLYAFPALAVLRLAAVHTFHAMALREEPICRIRNCYRWLFKAARIEAISVSNAVASSLLDLCAVHSMVISNGVSIPEKSERSETAGKMIKSLCQTIRTKVFINVGRLEPDKNQLMLIRVFNRLISEGRDVVLMLAGDEGSISGYREKCLAEAGPGIHFLGMINEIADYLAASDAFCLASLTEGLPVSLLEAMALGIVPICTPVGGIPEAICDGDYGFLSAGIDEESFYLAVLTFLEQDHSRIQEIRRNIIRRYTENYSIERCAGLYLESYRNAASENRGIPIELLVAGPELSQDCRNLGGAIVLQNDFYKFCRENRVRLKIFPTNRIKESGPLQLINFCLLVGSLLALLKKGQPVMACFARRGCMTAGPVFWIISRLKGSKMILRVFGGKFDTIFNDFGPLISWLMKVTILKSDLIFLETRRLANEISGQANVRWLPNSRSRVEGVKGFKEFRKKLVFFGHVREDKGVLDAIAAADILGCEYELDIFGPIHSRSITEKYFLKHNARYRGILNPNQCRDAMKKYDVLLLPTFFDEEGYPGVIIEGYSLGIPCITTFWMDIPEMVKDGISGILIRPGDVNGIVQAVKTIEADYDKFAAGAWEMFDKFDSQRVCSDMIRQIRELYN
ncbi:MAG: glycosyltransferase [Candidatus Wallbacteria bacterium]|nr:glycosyltransferase [Candidatus Wallbacteria bacterium]